MGNENQRSMQIITRHVEAGELDQQVCYPLPGDHVTVGKNRIRQFLTQLSLLTLRRSNIISPVRQELNYSSWGVYACMNVEWTCIERLLSSFSGLQTVVEMGTTRTHILAQIKNGSRAHFLLHVLFHFFHIKPENTWYAASTASEWWSQKAFQVNSKK